MYALFARVLRRLSTAPQASPAGVAGQLMESAEARTGLEAQELRGAACAYLRVVR